MSTKCKPNFAALHHLKTWNEHISATNCPFETNQRTDFITASNRKIVLVCGTFNPYANICPMIKKLQMGSSLAQQKSKKICLISAYAGMPCTKCVKGQVGQVWACPDASGRLYGCGKTGQNTDLLKIEYSKNSWFKPDKWAPAPPHVVKSELAQPVPYTLGASKFTSLYMEPISM